MVSLLHEDVCRRNCSTQGDTRKGPGSFECCQVVWSRSTRTQKKRQRLAEVSRGTKKLQVNNRDGCEYCGRFGRQKGLAKGIQFRARSKQTSMPVNRHS